MGVMWPLIFIGNPSLNKACQGLLVKVDESTYYYLCPKMIALISRFGEIKARSPLSELL